MNFEGPYKDSFGNPELIGSWLVWGESNHGKTAFLMELVKYLSKFSRVAYNSLEEGDSESMSRAVSRANIQECKGRVIFISESIPELRDRLKKQKAPGIVVIDSFQYTGMTYAQYVQLKKDFPKTLFIIVSHADGKQPDGKAAKKVRFDAFIKIRVEGFVAFPAGRYGGGKPFVVWKQGAEAYHGIEFLNSLYGQ